MEWTRTLRLCIFCYAIVTLHVYYRANCVTHFDLCTVYILLIPGVIPVLFLPDEGDHSIIEALQ